MCIIKCFEPFIKMDAPQQLVLACYHAEVSLLETSTTWLSPVDWPAGYDGGRGGGVVAGT